MAYETTAQRTCREQDWDCPCHVWDYVLLGDCPLCEHPALARAAMSVWWSEQAGQTPDERA
jgi:hypothetical protein